jgi:hypothetical protein
MKIDFEKLGYGDSIIRKGKNKPKVGKEDVNQIASLLKVNKPTRIKSDVKYNSKESDDKAFLPKNFSSV